MAQSQLLDRYSITSREQKNAVCALMFFSHFSTQGGCSVTGLFPHTVHTNIRQVTMTNDDEMKGSVVALLDRRRMLAMLGGTAAATVVGDLQAQSKDEPGDSPFCVVKPEQTEGPYFVDEKMLRSDLRLDPTDGSVRTGVPLRLNLRLSTITAETCSPLAGVLVDVWHNDARGEYSDVRDRKYDNRGKKFLRGYQLTDASGLVSFDTIYPGWYPGRTVHIHFKVRTSPSAERGEEFISQLYFDDTITDEVHARPDYSIEGQRSTRNKDDRIFRKGGEELMLRLRQNADGYEAEFELGLVRS
jgi:protocatechuate 3,4-dioxygenase beta subunit